jgi:hypothetical protein
MEPGREYYNEPRGICILCGINYKLDKLSKLSPEQTEILERYFNATNSRMMVSEGYICKDKADCDAQVTKLKEQMKAHP